MTTTGTLPQDIETVVVGAGQAGLTASALLRDAGQEHVVLDGRDRLGGGWLDRWDSFCLVTPNWTASFAGFPYDGDDPDGFMTRDQIAARVARYAAVIHAPVELGARVEHLGPADDGRPGFRLVTPRGAVRARRVIVATGGFHEPRIPVFGAALPTRIAQYHPHTFRGEHALPPGAVLVVGSGQSGVQIADELHAASRRVILSTGRCGRVPRRYRGRDIFHWLWHMRTDGAALGIPLPTVEHLPDPRLRFACNPQLSGHDGGHDMNLRRMASDGIVVVGRLAAVEGERVAFAPDLAANLAFADAFFDERLRGPIDTFIERSGAVGGPDDREAFAFEPPQVDTMDLAAERVGSVIWTTGYRFDAGWIGLPILDTFGTPDHLRGVSRATGLYFLGLPWQRDQASATLFGVASDGNDLMERILAAG